MAVKLTERERILVGIRELSFSEFLINVFDEGGEAIVEVKASGTEKENGYAEPRPFVYRYRKSGRCSNCLIKAALKTLRRKLGIIDATFFDSEVRGVLIGDG